MHGLEFSEGRVIPVVECDQHTENMQVFLDCLRYGEGVKRRRTVSAIAGSPQGPMLRLQMPVDGLWRFDWTAFQ
jgi:hypothetical protein